MPASLINHSSEENLFFTHLTVQNFRNYPHRELTLSPGLNCLTGPNGVGKTNLLEAVHYLAMTRGFRADREAAYQPKAEMMPQPFFLIEGALQEAGHMATLQCNYAEGRGKRFFVDGRPLARLSEHLGRVPLVAILPDDTVLVREGGTERRKWLDGLLAQSDRTYLEALLTYDRALTQRNALLTAFTEQHRFDGSELSLWDAPLSEAGQVIAERRSRFMRAFLPYFLTAYGEIAPETPGLSYQSPITDNTPRGWIEGLGAALRADRAAGRSTWGTHRDDLGFTLEGRPVKQYGSQGQQKSFVLALKLAQYSFLAAQVHKAPLLLLDDIFDRLDATRAANLFALLGRHISGQVFLTDTSLERVRQALGTNWPREVSYFELGITA